MSKERFRTNYNIFGNNILEETESESESESPFNINMLQVTKQEAYPTYIRDLNELPAMRTETDLSFESTLEQESPFRIIQYTDKYGEGETPHEIANRLTKGKPYAPGELSKRYHALPPPERAKVIQIVNQRFRELLGLGDTDLVLDPKNPENRPMIRLWLQLRDDEMRKRSGLGIIARPLNGLQSVQTTLVGGIEIMKLGIVYKADPYLSVRASANANSEVVAKLDFNARVFIHKELPGNWYFIISDSGRAGYIPKWTVKLDPPDPLAKLHKIQLGESAIGIAERYYKKYAQDWGSDLRFYINVLVYANDGDGNTTKGIYRLKGDDWKNAKTREGYYIWVPTVEYARQLKGKVKSGSITYETWQTVKNIAYKVWSFIKFGAAFIAGLIHGIVESLWDILIGIKDLAEMLWSIIKSIFSGNIISDAKELYDQITSLDYRKIAEDWIKDFSSKWNHESSLKRGHFRGWVVGYVIAEIVMTFVSFGTLTGIKWTGKMAKWTGELAKLAKIVKDSKLARRILSKVDSAKGRIKPLLEDIKRRIPKKLGNVLSRTEALENLRRLESKYGEYILKGLGLSSPEGREAILRVLPNLTNDQLENFIRKAQHFLSEEGKTHLGEHVGKFLGWSLEEAKDWGFKGKVLEKIIQDFGRKSLDNLNELLKNFPVVDAISNRSGRHIFSIARGTPEYLYDKIQVLFNVKITMTGVESANLNKFDTMLSLLQKNDKIKDLSDYMNRARLLIPDHAVLPFKAMIVKRVKDPIWRQRMLNAVVSGF